jgi:hypothetical protein
MARVFNFAHVPQSVLVDPTFEPVKHRDADITTDACRECCRYLRRVWLGEDDARQVGR